MRSPFLKYVSSQRAARETCAFMLLEIMIAVAIFALAVVGLGQCMNSCFETQAACARQERALLALQNRMIEVQASPIMPDESNKHALKGMFNGMTMIERRRTLNIQNENNSNLANLQEITLSVEYPGPGGAKLANSVVFTILRGQQ